MREVGCLLMVLSGYKFNTEGNFGLDSLNNKLNMTAYDPKRTLAYT
jgi:hypothetical protein